MRGVLRTRIPIFVVKRRIVRLVDPLPEDGVEGGRGREDKPKRYGNVDW